MARIPGPRRLGDWHIAGPYADGRFCLVEVKDDGEQYARGMFDSRADARARHRELLAKARGETA